MRTNNDYLSEFEREFEGDSFSSENEYEDEGQLSEEFNEETDSEYELDNEFESQDEFEMNDEFELNEEFETQDEYELEDEQTDSEFENYLQETNFPDQEQEFEDRLYSALNGEHESSFEMEQEIDRVLHEMEVEYFWKAAKGLWKKHKKKLMPFAKHLIPGGTLASLAKYAGGDVRGLLKKGLTVAANAYLPGVGGAIVGGLLNRETPNANNARVQARQTVRVAKNAYQNMARLIPNLRPGNIPNQISRFSQQSLTMAKARHRNHRGKNKKVIRISSNSVVVVKRDRIIIYS